jgi:hypothetical protein
MNLRRGFFRTWIVLSALWVMGVSAASYDEVIQAFRTAEEFASLPR